jgi:hypothetical protein
VQELTYQSSGGGSYLCFDVLEDVQLDERTLNAQLANDVPGLAKLSRLDKFGAEQLRFNVTSRIPLSQFLAVPVPEETLVSVVRGIVSCWQSLRRFQIQPNCVVLNPDYVFVSVAEQRSELICLPIVRANRLDLLAFLRDILGRAVLRTGAGYQLYGQLMSLLNQPDATVEQVAAVVGASDGAGRHRAAPVSPPAPEPAPPAGSAGPGSPPPGATAAAPGSSWAAPPPAASAPAPAPAWQSVPSSPAKQPATPPPAPTGRPAQGADPGFAVPGGPAFQQPPSGKKRGIAVPPVAAAPPSGEKQVSAMRGMFGSKADTEAWRRQKAAKKAGQGAVPEGTAPTPAAGGLTAPGAPAPPAGEKHVSAMRGMFGSKADTEAWRRQKAAKKAGQTPPPGPPPGGGPGAAPTGPPPYPPPPPQAPPAGPPTGPQPYPPPPGDPRSPAPAASPPPPGSPQPSGAGTDFGGTVDFSQFHGQLPGQVQGTTLIGLGAPAEAPAKGRIVINRRTGRQAVIEKAEFSFGRDPSWADFAVEDNSNVSAAHAIIRCVDGQYYLMDTNSTNHVTLNGQRIPPNRDISLSPGSVFTLGDEEFEFR